jgi:acetyl esterase
MGYSGKADRSRRDKWRRILFRAVGIIAILALVDFVTFQVSPWPSALIIRKCFERSGAQLNKSLGRYVPADVSSIINERYDEKDNDAYLDVYFPSEAAIAGRTLPTIVWVHGGAWVSCNKETHSNYYKILAGKGFTVVAVDYSLAPYRTYPTPVRQVNAALSYLKKNAKRLHIDLSRFFLAGDSAGSHIVAQIANIICAPSYASSVGVAPSMTKSEISGVILYCGTFDLKRFDQKEPLRGFFKTLLWIYSGTRNFKNKPGFMNASVINYITPDFPPTFISVGNGDPLRKQSTRFAAKAASLGVFVDSLFFPDTFAPPLVHEYQFHLETEAGRLALNRCLAFLSCHPITDAIASAISTEGLRSPRISRSRESFSTVRP